MALTVPEATRAILETIDSELLPTSDIELSGQLLPVLRDENLSQDERKAAWAEATAFNFDSEGASPWGTFYGPVFTGTKADGSNHYAPDIAETDDSIFEYWEIRSAEARHPVLRARYADLVWDLKSRAISQRPNIRFAQIAIDSYIEAVGAKLFDGSIRAVQGCSRMLSLSLAVNDRGRVTLCKQAMLEFFNDSATPGHAGVWTVLFDSLTESKKVGLTIGETEGLIHTLEELLTACTQLGSAEFDPFSGHPAATRLASHYESIGEKDKAHRAIRAYGTAFEQRAVDAGPLQAMTWLQPVHDEYYKRGMSEDAERVRIALVEKGKNIGDDLTSMEVPIEITREQLRDFVAQITDGSVREALLRIAALFIPSANGVRAMLDAFGRTPRCSPISV